MRRGSDAIVLALALPLVATVADPVGWYPFGPSKWLVVSTLLPAGLAWLWWRRPLRLAPRATAPVLALVVWLAVGAATGQDRLYAWIGTPERHLGVLTWVLVAALFVAGQGLDPVRDRRVLSWSIIGAGLLAGGLATAEALGWEPALFAVTPGRLTASMGSAAYLGALTALLLPALVGLALDAGTHPTAPEPPAEPGPPAAPRDAGAGDPGEPGQPARPAARGQAAPPDRPAEPTDHDPESGQPEDREAGAAGSRLRARRVGAALAAALTTVACVGSGARAAWLGLAVAAAVVLVGRRRTLLADRRRALVVGAGLAAALVLLAVVSPLGHRLAQATDPDAAGGRSRVDEWRVATTVLADHPWTGVGPEGYRVAFAEGVTDRYEAAYGRDPIPDRAHTAPLDVALAGGIPALVAWALAVGVVLRAAFRVICAARPDQRWLGGLAAALVAHFAGQLLLFPVAELEPIVWLLGGLLVAADLHASAPVRDRVVPRAVSLALGTLALLAALAGVRDVLADRDARTASDRAAAGDTAGAVEAVDAAVALRPDVLRLHLFRAQLLVADQRGTTAALAAVDDALALSTGDPIAQRQRAGLLVQRAGATHLPADVDRARRYVADLVSRDRSNAALELLAGTAARLAGDATAAEAAFRRAEELAPRDPEPCIELTHLFLDTGRRAEAQDAAARAVARAPGDPRALDAQRLAAGTS